jgi:peptide/nickel transport system permease protein
VAQVLEPTEVAPIGAPVGGEPSQQIVGRSPWQLFWRRFKQDKLALAGIVVVIIIGILAGTAGLIAKYVTHHGLNDISHYREMTTRIGLPKGPNGSFWFGADTVGRDLFVRVLYGARISLGIAFFATGISVLIGVTLGLLAGFYRGKVDTVISRTIDVVLSMPILLLAISLAFACGAGGGSKGGCLGGLIKPGFLMVSYIIGFFNWPYIARIVRGQVFSLREKEFVESARAQGSGNLRIMFREVLPNVMAPILVYTTLIIPNNILFEAALSFLGVGVPPEQASWGRMLSDASSIFTVAWWMMVFPGLFLFMTTLAFNLVGDGLRDALDPKTGR